MKKVLIGLSGGVDSAMAAHLLQKSGFEVIGAFLKCFSDNKDPLTEECSYLTDLKMAQRIASKLKIKLIILDYEKEYKSLVIKPMLESYKKGMTPNPDVSCNTIIKFPVLWKHAKSLNCNFIATGHYAKIKETKESYSLHQPKDKTKDQTYFLYELTQKDLSHTLFPLGNLTKSKVREMAKSLNFPNWDKKGTRGLCFIGKIDFKSFLNKRIKNKPGKIIDPEGNEIGIHKGSQYFTIGERALPSKGLEITEDYRRSIKNKKIYIAKKKGNTIIVAPESHQILKKNKIRITNLKPKIASSTKLKARIRHLSPLLSGKLKKEKNKYYFILKSPAKQIAPGQSIVLYNKTEVVAGGKIHSAE